MGKTRHSMRRRDIKRKHPHRRGEDKSNPSHQIHAMETPPQAWGRRMNAVVPIQQIGNTPTGVGKTMPPGVRSTPTEKHPHRRGEDGSLARGYSSVTETPPQAWGRQLTIGTGRYTYGNTPTGVGKTRHAAGRRGCSEKHPHRRGEDPVQGGLRTTLTETPPQAWGRQALCYEAIWAERNTPTGVGKTTPLLKDLSTHWKHPHRRGEDKLKAYTEDRTWETPPQAWGRLKAIPWLLNEFRNTPTGVGKTGLDLSFTGEVEKHPHRRGEDSKESLNFLTNALCHHSLSFSRTSCNPLMRTSSRR